MTNPRPIRLSDAVKYSLQPWLPHQKAAWEWLDDQLTADQREQFAELFRAAPALKPSQAESQWLVSKVELAQIMLCSVSSLSDSSMQDLNNALRMFGITDRLGIAYFLGQCGHESAGLRYATEIHDGSDYEYRADLGNTKPGDGVKYAGTGYIQVTGRGSHQAFSDYLATHGRPDPRIMADGKTYTAARYAWMISAFWWWRNNMIAYCKTRPDIDRVGQRVNGVYPPRGAEERRAYTRRAMKVLGV